MRTLRRRPWLGFALGSGVGGLKRKGSEYSSSEVGGTKVAGRGEVGVAVDTSYSEVCQVCRATGLVVVSVNACQYRRLWLGSCLWIMRRDHE
jgi:hypothetical protein